MTNDSFATATPPPDNADQPPSTASTVLRGSTVDHIDQKLTGPVVSWPPSVSTHASHLDQPPRIALIARLPRRQVVGLPRVPTTISTLASTQGARWWGRWGPRWGPE